MSTGLTEALYGVTQTVIFADDVSVYIVVDATLDEQHKGEAEVTEFPVETGADITDHIRPKPIEFTMTGVISNTPLDFLNFGSDSQAEAAWADLLKIQEKAIIVNITTALRTFYDMALLSVTCTRDAANSNIIKFTSNWRQIKTVSSETIAIPDTPRPEAKPLGSKATGPAETAEKDSMLDIAVKEIGSTVGTFFGSL